MEGDPHPIVVASEEESLQDVSLEIFVKRPGEDMSVTYMHWWRGRRCGSLKTRVDSVPQASTK